MIKWPKITLIIYLFISQSSHFFHPQEYNKAMCVNQISQGKISQMQYVLKSWLKNKWNYLNYPSYYDPGKSKNWKPKSWFENRSQYWESDHAQRNTS